VQDIRLRVTVLRDLDGNVHYVPNGEITVASNLTQRFARVVVDVGVAYDTDLERALGVLRDVLREMDEEDAVLEESQILGVQELGDSAVVLRGLLVTAPEQRWAVKREALKRVKERFDREGIEIPYPQRTVHLRRS
jgi:small conductance mechanosensitive channel